MVYEPSTGEFVAQLTNADRNPMASLGMPNSYRAG